MEAVRTIITIISRDAGLIDAETKVPSKFSRFNLSSIYERPKLKHVCRVLHTYLGSAGLDKATYFLGNY